MTITIVNETLGVVGKWLRIEGGGEAVHIKLFDVVTIKTEGTWSLVYLRGGAVVRLSARQADLLVAHLFQKEVSSCG
jgi:hypothetical protein